MRRSGMVRQVLLLYVCAGGPCGSSVSFTRADAGVRRVFAVGLCLRFAAIFRSQGMSSRGGGFSRRMQPTTHPCRELSGWRFFVSEL
jgi:hypothetical protein